MLIADDFVFVHIPKTGGTFVQRVVLEHLPNAAGAGFTHMRYADIPAHARSLPGFYVVRNPWDWYVSWFHYSIQRGTRRKQHAPPLKPPKAIVWHDLLRDGEASFAEAVTRAAQGDFDHSGLFPALDERVDLYTAYVRDIAGPLLDHPDFTALRFERLRKQLCRFLTGRAGVDKALLREIRTWPPERASTHRPYADYYDDGLRRLVATKTEWLCDRFGYQFG